MSNVLSRALDLLEGYYSELETIIDGMDETPSEQRRHKEVAEFLIANGRNVAMPSYPDVCWYCGEEFAENTLDKDDDGDFICDNCSSDDDDDSCECCNRHAGFHNADCERVV